ncbi:MAG: hypothetical protein DRI80_13225 [Chloroflexota bacterium]|nr:MAG: hypothetical protein DRI80_13225 [Chloroflexota bacterium]
MQISERSTDGVTVVALRGDFDAATAPSLEKRLQALVAEGRHRLVVDLSGVPYIASAGPRSSAPGEGPDFSTTDDLEAVKIMTHPALMDTDEPAP